MNKLQLTLKACLIHRMLQGLAIYDKRKWTAYLQEALRLCIDSSKTVWHELDHSCSNGFTARSTSSRNFLATLYFQVPAVECAVHARIDECLTAGSLAMMHNAVALYFQELNM